MALCFFKIEEGQKMTLTHNYKTVISFFIGSFLVSGCLLCSVLPDVSYAAVFTNITSDGTLGTQVTQNGKVYNIDGGTIRGSNLFQSFGLFSVGTGDSASFNGPNGIENIVGRITGGRQSMIDGLIRSTIPGSNIYLLNPSGFLFGANATLDVSGSFHVSTADFLRLGSEGVINVNPVATSVLTTAPPSAFGFLNNNPAAISIQGSLLQVPVGKTVSMVGGGIDITGGLLWAPGGRINLTSVASPGEISLSDSSGVMSFAGMGSLTISDKSVLNVQGSNYDVDPAGTIVIKGGTLFFKDANIKAGGNPGGTIKISAEQLHLDDTFVNAATRGEVDHPGTAVEINVPGNVLFTNGSEIASSSFNAGRAGDVRITAGNIQLGDDDPASSLYASQGFYGDIGSRAFGSGRGGDVYITADSLTARNGFFINTAAQSSGDAGNVTVRVNSLQLLDGGSVSSNGLGTGSGGIVDIAAGDVVISAKNITNVPNCSGCLSGLAAQTGYGSKGGLLKLTANDLQILDGGKVSTVLYSTGPGADMEINAKNILISGVVIDDRVSPSDINAAIDARLIGTYASGTGGNINIVADTLQVTNGGSVGSSLYNAPGNAGNISIQAKSLEVSEKGGIFASSVFGTGNGGNLDITARDVNIIGAKSTTDPFGQDFTGLSTATKDGRGGDLRLVAGNILLTDRGSVTSGSFGSGQAGNIEVDSGSLKLLNGANILGSAFSSGNAGNVRVKSDSVEMSGVNPEPFVDVHGNSALSPSGIASQALSDGRAGDIMISANSLKVLDGARISTETFGSGNGGSIEIYSSSVLISGLNDGFRKFLAEHGMSAAEAERAASASISSASWGEGKGGSISIMASDVFQCNEGSVTTAAEIAAGGAITIKTQQLDLQDGTLISAASSGKGNAGDINLTASNTFDMRESSVNTDAAQADGGNITINALYKVNLLNSGITASVGGGPQTTGGNITIDPQYVILNKSRIVANAYEGKGGNIKIVADTVLQDPESIVDASSALGISGTVDIQAAITNITGLVSPLSTDFVSATALLRERCIARTREGKYSSFVVGGRDGLPIEPGNVLPGFTY